MILFPKPLYKNSPNFKNYWTEGKCKKLKPDINKLSLFILLIFCITMSGQTLKYNDPIKFIPNGYKLYEKINGDLNKDGIEDCVLIIKKINPNNIIINRFDEKVDRNRRGLIILFKKDNSYRIAEKNLSCFSSENEDGGVYFAPELFLEIKNGNLKVNYGHGRYGFTNYTFRFQNSKFKLIGYDSANRSSVVTGFVSFDLISINYLTKKKVLKKIIGVDKDENEKYRETWEDIHVEKLTNLSDIIDFDYL